MLSRIHQKLGTAGFVISIVALIAALGGTAAALTAADKNLIKKESKKFSKQFSKKFAKPGPIGATGPQGPPGANGKDGTNGTPGKDGTNGTNGESVTVTTINAGGAKCEGRSGAEVKQEGAVSGTDVCSGKEGSPWTAGGVLPVGKTLTGAFNVFLAKDASTFVPISFPLAITNEVDPVLVAGASAPGCPGVTAGLPAGDPGYLCLYQTTFLGLGTLAGQFIKPARLNSEELFEEGTGPTGTILGVQCSDNPCNTSGVWAATAGS